MVGAETKRTERRSFFTRLFAGGSSIVAGLVLTRAVPAQAPENEQPTATFGRLGICVSDLDRSLKFYSEAFGFKIEERPGRLKGPQMAAIIEIPDVDTTYRLLDTGSTKIELFGYANPKVIGDGKRRPMNALGMCMISLTVKDINATLSAVRAAGGTVLQEARLGPAEKPLAIMVLDPDGTRIELTKD
jgi:lactoylglutathione lyase